MNRTTTRRLAAGAAALSLLTGGAVLAGCGSSSSSSGTAAQATTDPAALPANGVEKLAAKEILARSLAAAKAASSVAIKGRGAEEGEGSVSLDLVLGTKASKGTLALGGFSMEFRVVGGKTYSRIDREGVAAILGQGEGVDLLGDRWIVESPAAGGFDSSGFGDFADRNALLETVLGPDGTATVKGTGDVKGMPVVFVDVTRSDGKGTVAIQTVGEPYPVRVTSNTKDGLGEVTFSDWNAPVTVSVPEGAVSAEELMKTAGGSN